MSLSNTKSRVNATLSNATVRGAVYVAIGLSVGQVMSYLLSLASARMLGPANYSVFGSMLALMMMGSVLALGVQAAGAKYIVRANRDQRGSIGMSVVRWAALAALAIGIATLVVTPALVWLLHLGGPMLLILVALNLAPITFWGGQLGIAQGHEANARLALIYAIGGFGRTIGGIVLVITTKDVSWTMAGMAAGMFISLAVSWLFIRVLVSGSALRLPGFVGEIGHATHALFALFVLTNIDVLLARHFLPAASAGLYAAGAVVTKVAFWLPQFVATVAYPRMADHRRAQTMGRAALAVIGIGALTTIGVALFPQLVVFFIGGSAYEELVSEVWIFAAIGAAYALAQFLLYGQIAASKRAAIAVLWIAVLVLVGCVWLFHASVLQIAIIVLVVALCLALIGGIELLVELRREARSEQSVDHSTVVT